MKTKLILLVAFFVFATSSVSAQVYKMKNVLITEVVDKSEDGYSDTMKTLIRETLSQAISKSGNCQSYTGIQIKTVDATFDRHGNVTQTILRYVQGIRMGSSEEEKEKIEYILVTEVAPLSKTSIFLSARIIKAATGKIVGSSSVRTAPLENCVVSACRTLANDLVNSVYGI